MQDQSQIHLKKVSKFSFTTASVLTLLSLSLFGAVQVFAENQISVLTSLTPAGSFTAISDKLKGSIVKREDEISAEILSVSVDSLKTDNSLRDEHLHKHLNSEKFPRVILTHLKGKGGKATASLEMNGVKKPIEFSYVEKGSSIIANLMLKGSDFNLPKAKYLGVGVRDDVKVNAVVDVKAETAAPSMPASAIQKIGPNKKK